MVVIAAVLLTYVASSAAVCAYVNMYGSTAATTVKVPLYDVK
jgi:hypothetical protein